MPHRANQRTRFGFTRHNRCLARFAAKLPAGSLVESQFPFQQRRFRAVAFIAVLDEHRPNFLLEKLDSVIRLDRSDKPQQRGDDGDGLSGERCIHSKQGESQCRRATECRSLSGSCGWCRRWLNDYT